MHLVADPLLGLQLQSAELSVLEWGQGCSGSRQTHRAAIAAAAVHRDVEGSTPATHGDRTQPVFGEVKPQGAQPGGFAETKGHTASAEAADGQHHQLAQLLQFRWGDL